MTRHAHTPDPERRQILMSILSVLPDAGMGSAGPADVAQALQTLGLHVRRTGDGWRVSVGSCPGGVSLDLMAALRRLRRESYVSSHDSDPIFWRTRVGSRECALYFARRRNGPPPGERSDR